MNMTHENISEQVRVVESGHRDQMEVLRGRLALLSGTDKVLMTMYVQNGNSFRQIARVGGISETSVARKVHKIAKRLTDGQYIRCLRNSAKLTPDQMAIAKDFFLTGLAMSRIAAKRRSSVHRVRRALAKIRDLVDEPARRANASQPQVGLGGHEKGKP
jgi:predicted DNA-binding protein YlxM (UPF0122 family)